jgi:hypothetical protein
MCLSVEFYSISSLIPWILPCYTKQLYHIITNNAKNILLHGDFSYIIEMHNSTSYQVYIGYNNTTLKYTEFKI